MSDNLSYRERFQMEMEASLTDVLLILRLGVSGPTATESAEFIAANFFRIPHECRRRAILDPRVVSSLEGIQRLIASYGETATMRPEWIVLSGVVLRLELYCRIYTGKPRSVPIHGCDDSWISIPGTSLYLSATEKGEEARIERSALAGVKIHDAHPPDTGQNRSLPHISYPESALAPPIPEKRLLSLSTKQRIAWESTIAFAFDLLAFHTSSLKFVKEHAWILVPIENESNDEDGYFSSISFSTLPHAIYTSWHSGLMLAETLVHESDHQWLYGVERFEEFWLVPEHSQESLYRSPWRDDPRPLSGLRKRPE